MEVQGCLYVYKTQVCKFTANDKIAGLLVDSSTVIGKGSTFHFYIFHF